MHGSVGLITEPIIPHPREGPKEWLWASRNTYETPNNRYCHIYFEMTKLIAVQVEKQDIGIISDIESNFLNGNAKQWLQLWCFITKALMVKLLHAFQYVS